MEYEIYYLCNVLGMFLVIAIVLFHFVEADRRNKDQVVGIDNLKKEKLK
jgi:hypothetical protein